MTPADPIDDIRTLLRRREALLIHFNTLASRHPQGYPDDLRDALGNPHWRMCYSTIQPHDLPGNLVPKGVLPGAFGSVGIVVDLGPASKIERVCDLDAGSDGRLHGDAFGTPGSVDICEHSLDHRTDGHNEWLISEVVPIGIFIFPDPWVCIKARGGNVECPPERVIADFPDQRIFGKVQGEWLEYDRPARQWSPRTYDEIVPPPETP